MFCRSFVSVFLFVYQLKHLRLRGNIYMRFMNEGQRCNDKQMNNPLKLTTRTNQTETLTKQYRLFAYCWV